MNFSATGTVTVEVNTISMPGLQNDLKVAAARDFSELSLEDLKRLVVLTTQLRSIALKERDRKKASLRLMRARNSSVTTGVKKTVAFRTDPTAPELTYIRIDAFLLEDWMEKVFEGKRKLRALCEEIARKYPIDDDFPLRVENRLLTELSEPHPNQPGGHSDPQA